MKIVAIILISLVILILLPFLFLFICGLFVDAKKQYDRDSRFFRGLLDGSTTVILWCLGVRYNIVGEEKFPAEGNFLFISNHRSNYDPIVQWTVFKRYKISCLDLPTFTPSFYPYVICIYLIFFSGFGVPT